MDMELSQSIGLSEDAGLYVRFYSRSVYNKAKSEGYVVIDNDNRIVERVVGAGRPIYEDVDFVIIHSRIDPDSIPDRQVLYCGDPAELRTLMRADGPCRNPTMCDVHRFPRLWAMYKAGQAEQHSGTSLREWPGVSRSQVEDLAYHKVYTVEQLAALNDRAAANFLPQRQKAKDYLEAAQAAQATGQQRAEMEALRVQNEALAAQAKERDEQLRLLQSQMAELVAAQTAAPKKSQTKGA